MSTRIEWTDETWNPVRGCAIVSKGCTNCYAMRQAHRQSGPGGAYEGLTMMTKAGPVWTGKVRMVPELLGAPFHWKRPRRIFVNSMSDLFHEDVPDDIIAQIWFTMATCQRHTFQILTKRPQRMLEWVTGNGFYQGRNAVFYGESEEYEQSLKKHGWPLRNVWLGVSVEDQVRANERIPPLLKTPAAVRWVSAEPLLGPVDLYQPHAWAATDSDNHDERATVLDWVVAGGESGPGARPSHPDWFRSLRDQCARGKIAFFFKQWGAWAPVGPLYSDDDTEEHLNALDTDPDEWPREVWLDSHGNSQDGGHQPPVGTWALRRVGKRVAGRMLDGRTHGEYPA